MSVFLQPAEGVHLEHLDEPVEIRLGLREALLDGADWREGFSSDICIGIVLWERWRSTLEPAGMDREAFVDVLIDYGRELWLWLMGERQWDEFLAGLAGRVSRRLPAR
jgi:hypothetical protein